MLCAACKQFQCALASPAPSPGQQLFLALSRTAAHGQPPLQGLLVEACVTGSWDASQVPLLYLKPVQTGFPADSDARLVVRAVFPMSLVRAYEGECSMLAGQNGSCTWAADMPPWRV